MKKILIFAVLLAGCLGFIVKTDPKKPYDKKVVEDCRVACEKKGLEYDMVYGVRNSYCMCVPYGSNSGPSTVLK